MQFAQDHQEIKEEDDKKIFMATDSKDSLDETWILDTGSTQHMTFQRKFIWNFRKEELRSINLADNTSNASVGIGDVKMLLLDGKAKIIKNVWYVPTLKKNLLSLT